MKEKFLLQGTRLRIHPREISALDQDQGIKSPILYSFNSGNFIPILEDVNAIFFKEMFIIFLFFQLVQIINILKLIKSLDMW